MPSRSRSPRTAAVAAASAAGAFALAVAVAAPAQAATTVATWNMGDTGSTMSDASGHGHTGKLTRVATGQPGTSGGKGFGFGSLGTPSFVSVGSASDLNPGTSAFSFSLSVKFANKPGSDYDLLRKGLSSTDGGSYKMEIWDNGKAFCDFRGSSAEGWISAGPNLADNAWHQITCSRTSTSVKLTVDGSSYSKSVKTGTISNSGSLYLGAKNGGGQDQYKGLMDKVSVSRG